MTKYVIGPDVAIRLAHHQVVIGDEHQILAPTLLRSQMLSLLYRAVHRGEMTKEDAERAQLRARAADSTARRPRPSERRLEGADQLGWSNTYSAEYVALTQLQADAFITLDGQLAHAVKDLVTIAQIEALS